MPHVRGPCNNLHPAIPAMVLWLGAAPCLAANLPSLGETGLFAKIVHGCTAVDLKAWRHPTRSLLLERKVAIEQVQLCNAGVYPVFFVRFPYDPQGRTADYFLPLYDGMRRANGGHPYSFVAISDNTVVNVRYRPDGHAAIEYEMYRP